MTTMMTGTIGRPGAEIDKRRDRSVMSGMSQPESQKKPSAHDEWIKKQYRKENRQLFKGGKEETEEQEESQK